LKFHVARDNDRLLGKSVLIKATGGEANMGKAIRESKRQSLRETQIKLYTRHHRQAPTIYY